MQIQTPPDQPIESWTDEELLDQYRYIRAELAQEQQVNKDSDNNPVEVMGDEIRRRGLAVPDEASAASPAWGGEVAS